MRTGATSRPIYCNLRPNKNTLDIPRTWTFRVDFHMKNIRERRQVMKVSNSPLKLVRKQAQIQNCLGAYVANENPASSWKDCVSRLPLLD